jgi:hypothetical protein
LAPRSGTRRVARRRDRERGGWDARGGEGAAMIGAGPAGGRR